MKRSMKNLSTLFLVLVMTASCIAVAYSQESSEKAKQIVEKTFQKYSDLLKKDGKSLNSIAAKLSIKGSGQIPMGGSGTMPLDVDVIVELYAARPHHLYLEISGNLGNAKIVVAGEEKVTATMILPGTMQFATMDVPEKVIQEVQKDDPQKPERMEEFWKEVVLTYEGVQDTKAGKAHKIIIKPRDPSEEARLAAYILDGKWDPARIEASNPEGGSVVIEFEKLELNANIPDERFVPDTRGYTQVSDKDLATAIMMQIMSSMMQQGTDD